MAEAAQTADEPEEAAAPEVQLPAKPKSKRVLIIGAAVAVVAAIGGGFFAMSHGKGETAKAEATAEGAAGHDAHESHESHPSEGPKSGNTNYVELSPPFVANLSDDEANRYLQVDMQALAHDSHAVDDVKTHMPRIRNGILMLLGQQHYFDINTREGKEKLQAAVLAEIQKIMTEQTGKQSIDAVYFTSFVMQ